MNNYHGIFREKVKLKLEKKTEGIRGIGRHEERKALKVVLFLREIVSKRDGLGMWNKMFFVLEKPKKPFDPGHMM